MVNTRFWNDNYISELDPTEKLLFLYFLTNPWTNICGIYELPLKNVVVDTGIEAERVRNIVQRFALDDKILYEDGWVVIKNFIKHQKQGSPMVLKGIKAELEQIPERLRAYTYPMDTLSHPNPNLNSNSNLNPKADALFDQLWKEYPKKVGKETARIAFKKLKPNEELTAKISAAIVRFKKTDQWKDNEGRYIPHFSTFLNQQRFEDEVFESKGPKIVDYERTERGMKPIFEEDYKKLPTSEFAKGLGADKRITN